MNRFLSRVAPAVVLVSAVLAAAPAAQAAPSCVAQSVQSEHDLLGSSWGHDLIAFLASNPEVLEEFGFDSFGDLARHAASQDPEACPADL